MAPLGTTSAKRLVSVDRFRGFIVFCMIFFIAAADFPSLGFLARFANTSTTGRFMIFPDMSLADLVDPIFIFLISLSYGHSFEKRAEKSVSGAYLHFLGRYLSFMGVGSIIVTVEYVFSYHRADPLLYQTILAFPAAVLLVATMILAPIGKVPKKVKNILSLALVAMLVILGVTDVILGIRDFIVVLRRYPDCRDYVFKHWSILHEIGFAGLLTLPFIRLKPRWRALAFLGAAALYTGLLAIPGAIDRCEVGILGGVTGAFGYMLIMLGGTVLMAFYDDSRLHLPYLLVTGVLGILAAVTVVFLPINVRAVTVNYVFFTLAVAAVLFYIVNLFNRFDPKCKFFVWWGRNPLPLFLVGLIFRLFEKMWAPAPDTPLLVAILAVFGSCGLLSLFAWFLYKKNIIIKF